MSSVCHSYVLVCHPYATRMDSYVICMSLVCTHMSFVCQSYELVCHLYVTRMCFYYEPLKTTYYTLSSFEIARKTIEKNHFT